ncbi:histone-lysine N-methyltransferase SETMAR [Trichonephila clavipes]|nr:histone-lysine N-methyltransferase SETMAR [Trichonephila clavipes]
MVHYAVNYDNITPTPELPNHYTSSSMLNCGHHISLFQLSLVFSVHYNFAIASEKIKFALVCKTFIVPEFYWLVCTFSSKFQSLHFVLFGYVWFLSSSSSLKSVIMQECFQRLQLASGGEFLCRATVFRWFEEFRRGHNSLQYEEHTGRPQSAVIPDKVSTIRKMLKDNNRCTYQMIQKELNIKSTAIHEIIREELHMKKVVCR